MTVYYDPSKPKGGLAYANEGKNAAKREARKRGSDGKGVRLPT